MKDKKTDDQPTFFVSRRGRQVGVHQVDLSNMDIESEAPTTVPDENEKTKNVPKGKRVSTMQAKQPFTWSKKKIALLVTVLIVLALPVAIAELVAAQYRQGSESAKKDLNSIIEKRVLPAQKGSTLKSAQIGIMASDINEIVAKMCRGGLLDNAAELYPRAKAALSDCKKNQTMYTALASELYSMERIAKYLEAVDGVIKPVATPITDEFAVIGAQQTLWLAVDSDLNKLSVPDGMRTAHMSLSTHVSAVASAWSALNTANNSQDAAGFTEAEKKLATEYEAIRAASGEFTEVLSKAQSELITSYNKLKQ